MKTFTMIKAKVGQARKVYKELKGKGVDVYALFGDWDFIVISESKGIKDATSKILDVIHGVDGIERTATLVEAEL